MAEYFLGIGYVNIECTDDEDIVNFVERSRRDVPLAREYWKRKGKDLKRASVLRRTAIAFTGRTRIY